MPKTSLHAFKAKDTRFVADWLKSKGLRKLFSVFEGIQEPFILSLACKSVVLNHVYIHERAQVICTGSTLSRGDFCFRVFCGWRRRYNLSSAVSVTVTSLIVGIWKVFKSMVSRDSERDVQPRPSDHSWPSVSSASLRSKMAPRKGFYLFALGINLDLTSKKTRWILNESVCITSPKWIFSLKKRAMVFQKKLRLSTAS